MRIGAPELLLTLLIVVILFGPSQIPKLGKLFGTGIKGFRDGLSGGDSEAGTNDDTEECK
ncbi:MAG: twin-arginine translocase TatA/TatE family subunit [Oscillospiraceae bacterium]|nr:twin-arginine translocase TatA/TatE family subunit [Oscillospiraceae bacterium]